MGRVLVIANKWFEVDPLVGVLGNLQARPPSMSKFQLLSWPDEAGQKSADTAKPRATVLIAGHTIEVWCIQDLMDPTVPGGFSNTDEKARVLPQILSYGPPPDLVVAFGTAATEVEAATWNGCVLIGSRVFVHNPYAQDPFKSPSKWTCPGNMDVVVESAISSSGFEGFSQFAGSLLDIRARMVATLGLPAPARLVIAEHAGVAISSVNVVDSSQYPVTDPDALAAARRAGAKPILSYESTHGVIRLLCGARFLFISGITNRVGHFSDETLANPYTQNFVAANNAAIAAAWMLEDVLARL